MADVSVVVFDIDDTLYLERDYVASGFRAVGSVVSERFGVAGAGDVMWRLFLAGERGTIFDTALAELGVEPSAWDVKDLVEVYRSHEPTIELLDDARVCLEELEDLVEVAVVTDGPVASQRAKIRTLGLDRWASVVVVTSEHGSDFGKPSTQPFALVERTLGVAPTACAYVADNPAKDFLAPVERDWQAVRVRREGGLHHAVDLPEGVLEVPDLWNLVAVLGLR